MSAETVSIPRQIFQLKITLTGTKPPIWRRLLAPADLTLAQLHTVLQISMGWENYHLHEFRVGRQRFGIPDPGARMMDGDDTINEKKVQLRDVLARTGAKVDYTYDFGDGWEHGIVLEKILLPESSSYPMCTDGKRRAPPEDCGGIGGYYNFLEAIHDPQNEQHDELLEWIGGSFDPEAFSIEDVNRRLAPLQRRLTKRLKSS